MTPERIRYAIGANDNVCANTIPGYPKMNELRTPKSLLEIYPVRPNMKMMARPITKGGVIIGKIEKPCINRLYLKRDRSITRAKARPITVASTPTDEAMKRLFFNILQVLGYARSVVKKFVGFKAPSTITLLPRMTAKGKRIKIIRRRAILRIDPDSIVVF